MGKTIAEKILARAAGKEQVAPGDYIEVASRCPVTLSVSLGRGMDEICAWQPKSSRGESYHRRLS